MAILMSMDPVGMRMHAEFLMKAARDSNEIIALRFGTMTDALEGVAVEAWRAVTPVSDSEHAGRLMRSTTAQGRRRGFYSEILVLQPATAEGWGDREYAGWVVRGRPQVDPLNPGGILSGQATGDPGFFRRGPASATSGKDYPALAAAAFRPIMVRYLTAMGQTARMAILSEALFGESDEVTRL